MRKKRLFKVAEAATLIAEVLGADKFEIARSINRDAQGKIKLFDSQGIYWGERASCGVLYGITSEKKDEGPRIFSTHGAYFHQVDMPELLKALGYHPEIQARILHACPALPDLPTDATEAPVSSTPTTPTEDAKTRRARRWQLCVDAGYDMPQSTYSRLPRGIKKIAQSEGISRQALSQDLKAHLEYLLSSK